MKKIKQLLLALIASFGMLTTLAGGLGIWVDDYELGRDKPPKGCGWSFTESDEIDCSPREKIARLRKERERTLAITSKGIYLISGSNTTDHVRIEVDADCTLHLEDLVLDANKMMITYAKWFSSFPDWYECGYQRLYHAITIRPKRKVTIIAHGKTMHLRGSLAGIIVCEGAELELHKAQEETDVSVNSIINLGSLTTAESWSGEISSLLNAGTLNYFGSGTVAHSTYFSYQLLYGSTKKAVYVKTGSSDDYRNCKVTDLSVHPELPVENVGFTTVSGTNGTLRIYGGTHRSASSSSGFQCELLEVGGGTLGIAEELIFTDGAIDYAGMDCARANIFGGTVLLDYLHATKKVHISRGNVRIARKEIAAPEISIEGGIVSANAGIVGGNVSISGGSVQAWGFRGMVETYYGGDYSGTPYLVMTPDPSHSEPDIHTRAAIGGRSVRISGGTVSANVGGPNDSYELGHVHWDYHCPVVYPLHVTEWKPEWQILGTAGIGGTGCSVHISGGTVIACAGSEDFSGYGHSYSGAAIGGDWHGPHGPITITGGGVLARGGLWSCAIGPGSDGGPSQEPIIITGGDVTALGGEKSCPAIYTSSNCTVIRGGTVYAQAGSTAGVTDVAGISGYHGEGDTEAMVFGAMFRCSDAEQRVVDDVGRRCYRVTGVVPGAYNEMVEVEGLPSRYRDIKLWMDEFNLWLPNGTYSFVVRNCRYTATVADADTTAVMVEQVKVKVTIDANGGEFSDGSKTKVYEIDYGSPFSIFDEEKIEYPTREGYTIESWDCGSIDSLKEDRYVTTYWKEKPAASKGTKEEGKVQKCSWLFIADTDVSGGGVFPNDETELELWLPVGSKIDLSEIPVPTPVNAGYRFYGWWDYDAAKWLEDGDTVDFGHNVFATFIENDISYVTFYLCKTAVAETQADFEQGGTYNVQRYWDITQYLSPGKWAGHRFVGWFSQPGGKGEQFHYDDWDGTRYGRQLTDDDLAFYAYWELDAAEWTMNRYCCATLAELGVAVPDLSTVKSVKLENPPKGVKLVQDKAKTTWYVEGVPTETRGIGSNAVAVRFQFKEKGRADSLQTLTLNVVPDVHVEAQFHKNSIVSVAASDLFQESVDATWKMSGMAANIKYATKDNTKWKDGDKAEHVESALTFYGQPNKLVAMTILGKKPVKSQVPGLTTSFTEVYSAEVLICPPYRDYNATYTVYANVDMDLIELAGVFYGPTEPNTTATPMPSGMKFTSKEITNNKIYGTIPAGSLYGKPTKIGIFAVTFKNDNNNDLGYVLIRVADPAAPEVGAYFGTKKTKLKKAIAKGTEGAEQNKPIALMVGATVSIPLAVSEGASVKASNLPAGLKLVQDKKTKLWTIEGSPTKEGSCLATVTATANKVSTTASFLFEVCANAFAGAWRGCVESLQYGSVRTPALVSVNVAAGGATKVVVTERGKPTYTYSAKSFAWDELNGNASLSFEIPLTKGQAKQGYWFTRRFTIELVDRGDGFLVASGAVGYTAPGGYELNLEDHFQAWPVVPAAVLNEHGVFGRYSDACPTTWVFAEDLGEDGAPPAPLAVVSASPDMKTRGKAKGSSKVQVKFADGTVAKLAKVEVVRVGADLDDQKSYAYAPFAATGAKAAGSRVYVFDALTANSSEAFTGFAFLAAGTVRYETGDGGVRAMDVWAAAPNRFNHDFLADVMNQWIGQEALMLCDFGAEGVEMFSLVRGDSTDRKTGGYDKVLVYDLAGELLATVNAKFVKETGLATVKFTSKDKVHTYTVDLLFDEGDFTMAGVVTDSWKDGKVKKTATGLVDVYGM